MTNSFLHILAACAILCCCDGNRLLAQSVDRVPLHEQIDALVEARLTERKVPPAARCDDAEFVRRVHLDLAGVVPTADRAQAFLDDPSPDKRRRLIDELLVGPDHPLHMARLFDVMLLERRVAAGGSSADVPWCGP